jgi:hypothetical protein
MRRAMASGEDERDHEWGDMAAVLEAMSGAVSQHGRRKHRAPRRLRSRGPCTGTGTGAPTNWLSVPVATASRAGPYTRALNL